MAEEVVRGLPGITPGFQCEKVSGEHLPPPATKVGGRQQRFRDSACQCGRMASRERGGKRDTKKAPLLAGPGNLFPKECPQRARETTPIFRTVGCGVATLLPKTGAVGLGAPSEHWGAHVGNPLAAMTAFDRPIGLPIMVACASNNSICFPQPASRRIVLCR
jgi:hypothetical protein